MHFHSIQSSIFRNTFVLLCHMKHGLISVGVFCILGWVQRSGVNLILTSDMSVFWKYNFTSITYFPCCTLIAHNFFLAAYDRSGSCVDRIGLCVSESVCNRHLTPVLQACMTDQCDSGRCRQEIQQFYGGMPLQCAEMLVMCECDDSDQSCLLMKTGLQSGACGAETRICQERLTQCVQDSKCR